MSGQHIYRQELADVRDGVFQRYNGTCRHCGQQGDRLDNGIFMEYIGEDDTLGLSVAGWSLCCELCMAEIRLTERAERMSWERQETAIRTSGNAGTTGGQAYSRRSKKSGDGSPRRGSRSG